jgi:hypothetical protein
MIVRTFHSLREHPDAYRRIEYPDASEWKVRCVRTVTGQAGGQAETSDQEYTNANEARKAAMSTVAQWMAEGWQEITRSGKPVAPGKREQQTTVKAIVSRDDLQGIAAEVAESLPANPDWTKIWDRLATRVPNLALRRVALGLVQQRHRDICNEQARMERLRQMAERIREQEQSKGKKADQDNELARIMAQQPAARPTDGRRRMKFDED